MALIEPPKFLGLHGDERLEIIFDIKTYLPALSVKDLKAVLALIKELR